MDEAEASGVFARTYSLESTTGSHETTVEVGLAGGRVVSVSFPGRVPSDASTTHPLLDRIGAALTGATDGFTDVDIALTVPTDQRRVLDALRSVPAGDAVSVSALARMAGLDANDPDDIETVTGAIRANPVAIIIGDHRVEGGPYATPAPVRAALRDAEGIRDQRDPDKL